MTAKTVAIGVVLALVALLSPTAAVADEDNAIGRYVIVPMKGHDALVLLDTKTGQNWIYTTKNFTWQSNPFFTKRLSDPPPPGWAYLPPSPPSPPNATVEELVEKYRSK